MKKLAAFIFFLLTCFSDGFAQEFSFRAPLEQVPENGFYRIGLSPEMLNAAQPGLADIRIVDKKGREVPYLLQRTEAVKTRKHFRVYPILSKKSVPGKNTELVLQNRSRSKINNIGLLIGNTNVVKKASLSGSADARNWYALEADIVLQSVSNTTETSEVKVLHFPLSDYEFYRLEINDSASAPLNIQAAGYYDFQAEEGDYSEPVTLRFTQTDSAALKQTYLKFSFPAPVLIDKLTFEINGPTFYRRNATVLVQQETFSRNRRRKNLTWQPVQTFQLESDSKNTLLLDNFRAKAFYVVVENADNPPLEFQQVKAMQLKTYLVAELKKGKTYELQFGNEKVLAPNYDLAYFREKIPADLPVLQPGPLMRITGEEVAENPLNRFFRSSLVIWIALVGVVILLGFMTWKMLKEAGK